MSHGRLMPLLSLHRHAHKGADHEPEFFKKQMDGDRYTVLLVDYDVAVAHFVSVPSRYF